MLLSRGRGTLEGIRENGVGNMAFYELVGGKFEVSYANNGQCSSI